MRNKEVVEEIQECHEKRIEALERHVGIPNKEMNEKSIEHRLSCLEAKVTNEILGKAEGARVVAEEARVVAEEARAVAEGMRRENQRKSLEGLRKLTLELMGGLPE